jgi:alkyl hydroperoxide reductase subunit AhpF
MTVIAEKDRPTVRELLARELVAEVELLLFTRGRSPMVTSGQPEYLTCDETHELLDELVGLSDRLQLTTFDLGADPDSSTLYNVTAVPTVMIRRREISTATDGSSQEVGAAAPGEAGTNVRFVGLPGGYEFSTLVADIIDVSKGRTDLSPAARAAAQAIETPVHIQVFVTPACPYCPPVARMAHQLAMENPLIVADVIEANEFSELSERYRVRSVPKTVINNRVEFVGSLPEAKVMEALQKAVSPDAQ